jgi:hypothetical protein
MSFFLIAWSFGDKKPKKGELESAFKLEIPGYVQLSDFDVDILENMGNKVDPKWGSRFKAIVKSQVPLYAFDQNRKKKKIIFVVLKNESGTKTEVYGKIISTIYQGKWKHYFDIEGRPIENLGTQLNQFSGRVLVRGSKEEKEYFTEIERQESELRKNIANAKSILPGTWRDENSLVTYSPDGTAHAKFDSGREEINSWRIEGDILIDKKIKYKKKKNNEWKHDNVKFNYKLIYIDQNKFTIQHGRKLYHSKRIK